MPSIFGHDYQQRKNLPIFSFLTRYFPKAMVEVVKVCVAGNAQHNPELPLTDINWSRGKSTDQLNTAMRHLMDHATSGPIDQEPPEVLAAIGAENGGTYHLAKAIWRIAAELELTIEKRDAERAASRRVEALDAVPVPEGRCVYGMNKGDAPGAEHMEFPLCDCRRYRVSATWGWLADGALHEPGRCGGVPADVVTPPNSGWVRLRKAP